MDSEIVDEILAQTEIQGVLLLSRTFCFSAERSKPDSCSIFAFRITATSINFRITENCLKFRITTVIRIQQRQYRILLRQYRKSQMQRQVADNSLKWHDDRPTLLWVFIYVPQIKWPAMISHRETRNCIKKQLHVMMSHTRTPILFQMEQVNLASLQALSLGFRMLWFRSIRPLSC